MNFQTTLNANCELKIISTTLDPKIKDVLNDIANARENGDNDFMSEIACYRTKRFQNFFVEFVSRSKFSVEEVILNLLNVEAKRIAELEELEMISFSSLFSDELDEALAS